MVAVAFAGIVAMGVLIQLLSLVLYRYATGQGIVEPFTERDMRAAMQPERRLFRR